MFFPRNCRNEDRNNRIELKRKEACSLPAGNYSVRRSAGERRFPVIFRTEKRQGSLTLETACVLPMFLFAMLGILTFAKIMLVSGALLAGMQDTAKDMAAYACLKELGATSQNGVGAELLTGGLSGAYAKNRILKKSGFSSELGRITLLQSDFSHSEIIDLAVSYIPDRSGTLIPLPKVTALLRARVRAWTGRAGSSGKENEDAGEQQEEKIVYVTTTGRVYHRDVDCTHIRLSVKTVSKSELAKKRNASGGKYHACEKCGSAAVSSVYITDYGDKYHSSLHCSGLKRNVKEVSESELKGWKPCSKCG